MASTEKLILDDICTAVARRLGITKADTERVVGAAMEEIAASLSAARPVIIERIGYFTIQRRPSRIARNPRRPDELVEIPSVCKCIFRPAPKIKRELIQRTVVLEGSVAV